MNLLLLRCLDRHGSWVPDRLVREEVGLSRERLFAELAPLRARGYVRMAGPGDGGTSFPMTALPALDRNGRVGGFHIRITIPGQERLAREKVTA